MGLLERISTMLARPASEPASEPLAFGAWGGGVRASADYVNVTREPHANPTSQPQDGVPGIGFQHPLPAKDPTPAFTLALGAGPVADPEEGFHAPAMATLRTLPSLINQWGQDTGFDPGVPYYQEFDHTTLLNGWQGPGYFNQSGPLADSDEGGA